MKTRTMFGRENLIWEYAEEFGDDSLYLSAQADEVMDKMENRIKELENENIHLKQELDAMLIYLLIIDED